VASQDRDDTEAALERGYGGEEEPESRARPRRRDEARERRIALAAGTAVHAALERLEADLEIEEQRRRFAAEVEAALALCSGPEDRAAARRRAHEVFERFRAGPLYERMRGLGPRLLARELPVLLAPGGAGDPVGFWSGSIDLLYLDPEDGSFVVADFKTDRVGPEGIPAAAARYAPQGEVYTRAVQAALGLPAPPRFELWFLSHGEVVPLPAPGREQAAG
jgi:ATP-dependent exoDNAse (exonuclease V) beta subunit